MIENVCRTLIALMLLLIFAFAQPTSAQKGKSRLYTIDASQSQITVVLAQEGLMGRVRPNHRVAVKTFNGKIEVPLKDQTRVSVSVEAESRSLTNVDKDISEFERKEFHNILRNIALESEKYPAIKFVSVSVTGVQTENDNLKFTLNGELTLHGVSKQVAVPVSVVMNNQELRGTGEAKLKQTDFGIKPYEGGFGAIKIGDEVKVTFVVVAKST